MATFYSPVTYIFSFLSLASYHERWFLPEKTLKAVQRSGGVLDAAARQAGLGDTAPAGVAVGLRTIPALPGSTSCVRVDSVRVQGLAHGGFSAHTRI